MDELELSVNSKKIKFVVLERLWCKLYLIEDDNILELGAGCLDEIISKLLMAFVPVEGRKHFLYKENELFTVLCLVEPHAVIAGKRLSDSRIELVFIDKEGYINPLVTLSSKNIEEWIKKIIVFLTGYKGM